MELVFVFEVFSKSCEVLIQCSLVITVFSNYNCLVSAVCTE